jgi:hypothetical protein
MASDYNKLTESVLVQLTKAEIQALKDAAGKEDTTSRNIIRRALKSYLGDRISDDLFTDRTQGNLSKNDREPAVN